MLNCKFQWIAATWLFWLCCNVVVSAQDGGKSSLAEAAPPIESLAATPVESPEAKVEEVRPSVYYLPDKQGNLQAVLDFSYEDFVELYKLKQRLDQAPSARVTAFSGCRLRRRQGLKTPN